MKTVLTTLALLIPLVVFSAFAEEPATPPTPHAPVQIVVLDRTDCVFCGNFKRQVARWYDERPISKRATLSFLSLDRDKMHQIPVWFKEAWNDGRIQPFSEEGIPTPTFLFFVNSEKEDGKLREVARFSGYANQAWWYERAELLLDAIEPYIDEDTGIFEDSKVGRTDADSG